MKIVRVMWLLNHTTLRSFEIEMLKSIGVDEVFTPKSFPYDDSNLSASITYEYDKNLTIPDTDLALLNSQNWYEDPSLDAWEVANKYFDVVFIALFPKQICSTIRHFKGQVVLRAFGLSKEHSYSILLEEFLTPSEFCKLSKLNNRFWFAPGYEHLKDIEKEFIRKRECFLPVGLKGDLNIKNWQGKDKRIFFVCPRINTSPYYNKIYKDFKKDFKEFSYVIGGTQSLKVDDKSVIGYVPKEAHEHNMRELRVMFYHSTEPNHVHYHPFEAIRNGMPLIFMAGGLLDRLGGKNLPGRCRTIKEAKKKIRRILNDDWQLIEDIRTTQTVLLDSIKAENCIDAWRTGFEKILTNIQLIRQIDLGMQSQISPRKKRIAVIIPIEYRGGSLRGAKLLAEAIYLGSLQANEEVEVVLGYLDLVDSHYEEALMDMPSAIKRRSYTWRCLDNKTANVALTNANFNYQLKAPYYQAPDDGINYFLDCDLLVFVSDRIEYPLLPLQPYVMVVFDYLQRYEKFLPSVSNKKFITAAHNAEKILVTTEFTKQDAIQFAGIPESKVIKCPMLIPDFTSTNIATDDTPDKYFLWTTNLAFHKNHQNAFKALMLYYDNFGGSLKCYITGTSTKHLFNTNYSHLKSLKNLHKKTKNLKNNVKILGELSDQNYKNLLANSVFLWHAARIDNGTFSVIEAASLGAPSLSSDYPPMREIDAKFRLNMLWMNPWDPMDMAKKLKQMELEAPQRRKILKAEKDLEINSIEKIAIHYWNAIKDCL